MSIGKTATVIEQLKNSAKIVECKYPREQGYKGIWIFDHSSCHGAYADDALLANRMNAKPGGKPAKLRDRVWEGKVQRMVFNVGVPKGLIQVLKEGGRYRNGMKLDEMRAEISALYKRKDQDRAISQWKRIQLRT